jgi:hypothetical protein
MTDQPPATEPNYLMALIQGTTGLPKSVAKLVDTIGEQAGLFLKPMHILGTSAAEADARVAVAKADAGIAVFEVRNKLAIRDVDDRAEERVRRREARRQQNIEAIAAQAAEELERSIVSEQAVDEDWVARFLEHSQDIRNEQMRSLWARILAGEVAKPGSFSLKTLALARVMDEDDANLFTRFCSMVWQTGAGPVPFVYDLGKTSSLAGIRLNFTDFMRLDSVGLIRFDPVTGFKFDQTPARVYIAYYNRHHVVSRPGDASATTTLEIGRAILTQPGQELASIAGAVPNEEYRAFVVACLREKGWQVSEGYGPG